MTTEIIGEFKEDRNAKHVILVKFFLTDSLKVRTIHASVRLMLKATGPFYLCAALQVIV